MEREQTHRPTIRQATLEDVPLIRAMQGASWLATYPNEAAGVDEAWVRERITSWMTPEKLDKSRDHLKDVFSDVAQFYRVATDGNAVVGIVHGLVVDGRRHLGALYVDARYHGTGVAQELMALFDEWTGGDATDLEVVSYNTRAIRFYEKYGFAVEEGSDHLFADKIPVVTMIRKGGGS